MLCPLKLHMKKDLRPFKISTTKTKRGSSEQKKGQTEAPGALQLVVMAWLSNAPNLIAMCVRLSEEAKLSNEYRERILPNKGSPPPTAFSLNKLLQCSVSFISCMKRNFQIAFVAIPQGIL